jgi:hypothetical protein
MGEEMSDIVERLRYQATLMLPNNPTILLKNAADEIERLRNEVKHRALTRAHENEQARQRIEELEDAMKDMIEPHHEYDPRDD